MGRHGREGRARDVRALPTRIHPLDATEASRTPILQYAGEAGAPRAAMPAWRARGRESTNSVAHAPPRRRGRRRVYLLVHLYIATEYAK
jgi:hypothetical protein